MTNYITGIDLGSTTAKIVIGKITGDRPEIVYSAYRRHHAKIKETVSEILSDARNAIGDMPVRVAITGSAGMGITENTGLPFVQEVVASANYIKKMQPQVRTFIEIGGEDSKIIFFDDNFRADMRMNGSCAGGTGSFIDQIAVLLDIPVEEFNAYASRGEKLFPIATRCGVFAKTDVQSLLAHNVSKENIAYSAFHAVALQVLSTLTRGRDIESKVLLAGGPLTFNHMLRQAFLKNIPEISESDIIHIDNPQLVPAMGTALSCDESSREYLLSELIETIQRSSYSAVAEAVSPLPPLFENADAFAAWKAAFDKYRVARSIGAAGSVECFLGIDSGSTTTKIVLSDRHGRLIASFYGNNKGNPVGTVQKGLAQILDDCASRGIEPLVLGSAVTGYGEGLIRNALNLDHGFVETMAHYRAAVQFAPDVSFILDIGGQDMKAMFIRDQYVADIQINEACSSGCGSFIETFANNMGYPVADFAELACASQKPYDLGTRCTVFMNTKVKQALREGTAIEDISAGLSFSVIKNSLYKVLKIKDNATLGGSILVQGGTFKNNSVLRAFELLINRPIVRPDIPELMGAYGCALKAADIFAENGAATRFAGIAASLAQVDIDKKNLICKGCENHCQITKMTFPNGNSFYIGNNCERVFTNNEHSPERGENLVAEKREIIFNRNLKAKKPRRKMVRIGIPRILNMFENFPFWATFLNECGFDVELSDVSNIEIFEAGVKSVMSENICFPAKIAHGHILNLVEKKVDRIFFPNVVFEHYEYEDAVNSFNCPVVTGYPCVIKSSIDPEERYGIPVDSPTISFKSPRLMLSQLERFMRTLGVTEWRVRKAYISAMLEESATKKRLQARAAQLIEKADETGQPLIVLAGRPYHIDKLINHGIPELICDLGAIVITEDSIPDLNKIKLSDINVLTQWTYTNRLYATAKWVSEHPSAQLIQLTSFGCGPDAVSVDEVKEILEENDKLYTQVKIDEVFNLGAVKIRVRSMLEALKRRRKKVSVTVVRESLDKKKPFTKEKTILIPYFSKFYSPLVPALFKGFGIKVVQLPLQDNDSINFGIRNINNEICYPAILIAGDIIKAYQKDRYDVENTMVLLTQTGGQCRASNYVNLVRKALDRVGFGDVQVSTMSTTSLKSILTGKEGTLLAKKMVLGILVLDGLMQMYTTTKPREIEKGSASALYEKFIRRVETIVGDPQSDYRTIANVLNDAVDAFNIIAIDESPVPMIGFVGEIFVKYNCFANMDLVEWVLDQRAEVVLPPLHGFFLQSFINRDYMEEVKVTRNIMGRVANKLIWNYVRGKMRITDAIMKRYRFYKAPHNLYHLSKKAGKIVSLANQFGEGWLLTADMLAMVEDGVENIISVQPFGCISNHVVAKGIEKKIRKLYPAFNLLAIDFDQSTSPANVFNRAHFMIAAARETLEKSKNEA